MSSHRITAAVSQLERYGGGPDSRVLRLLELLTDINDDIWHLRNPASAINKAREILDGIEQEPALTQDDES